jgi:hypothetical protein
MIDAPLDRLQDIVHARMQRRAKNPHREVLCRGSLLDDRGHHRRSVPQNVKVAIFHARADRDAAGYVTDMRMLRIYAAVDDGNADPASGAAWEEVHTFPSLRFTTWSAIAASAIRCVIITTVRPRRDVRKF